MGHPLALSQRMQRVSHGVAGLFASVAQGSVTAGRYCYSFFGEDCSESTVLNEFGEATRVPSDSSGSGVSQGRQSIVARVSHGVVGLFSNTLAMLSSPGRIANAEVGRQVDNPCPARSVPEKGVKLGEPSEKADLDLARRVPGVLDVNRLLGSGFFGDVWECMVDGFQSPVAVKVFKTNHTKSQDRECQLLTKLQHPNLVEVLRVIEGRPSAIMMEVCSGGSLWDLVHLPQHRAAFACITVRARVLATLDVVSCIEYLHFNKVLHRDVKPNNCLLSTKHRAGSGELPQVKLADFGLARDAAQQMTRQVGTFVYMAPELMEGFEYSFPVDIYSCGVLLYELLTGIVPFSGNPRMRNAVALVLAVSSGERPSLDALPPEAATQEIRQIIQEAWTVDPAERPTARSLIDRLRSAASMT